MKIYDRKGFILGLLCFLMIMVEAKHFDGAVSILWIGFFLYMGFTSIRQSMQEQKTEAAVQEELAERDERVRKQMLGPFWRFPEMMAAGLCFVGVAAYAMLWRSEWGGILLFVCFACATVFTLWYNVKYRELMEREENDQENTKS